MRADATFSGVEQDVVSDYLLDGGALFVSGAEAAYELIRLGRGVSFMQDLLHTGYAGDDAATFDAVGMFGSVFNDIGTFDFDPLNGAPYEVRYPDVLAPLAGAQTCLSYVGGTGGAAAVQFGGDGYGVIVLGFPFETITAEATRADIMSSAIDFLTPLRFDHDWDQDVDWSDFEVFLDCYAGPDAAYPSAQGCRGKNADGDADVDLLDFGGFQRAYSGSLD